MRYLRLMIFVVLIASMSITRGEAKQKQAERVDPVFVLTSKGDSCADGFDYYHASLYYQKAYSMSANATGNAKTANAGVTRKLANVLRRMGRTRECTNLLTSMPQDSVTYEDLRTLFYAYKSMDNRDSLLLYGDSILSINPYDSEIVVSFASYCNENDATAITKDICKKYLKGDSLNLGVRRQLAYAYYLSANDKKAYEEYKKLEDSGMDNFECTFIIGIALKDMNDMLGAYQYLRRATKFKQDKDFATLYNLGKVCLEFGNDFFLEEGIRYLMQAIAIKLPDSTQISNLYSDIGEGYCKMHKYAEAAEQLEKSAKYEPDKAIIYYNIAQMYGALANTKKERENYSLFLSKASKLKDTEENKELIKQVTEKLKK